MILSKYSFSCKKIYFFIKINNNIVFDYVKRKVGINMEKEAIKNNEDIQPQSYSKDEITELKKFIDTVKNDDSRSALACWGDHSDYSHGY